MEKLVTKNHHHARTTSHNITGVPQRVIQRGNNHQPCFFAEDDYRFYLQWLRKYAEKTDCMVDEIRKATNGNFALESERFKNSVEKMLARRVVPGKPGRPRKN